MKIPQHIYDLILANLLFGVSYSVVVALLERGGANYTPDNIFTTQIIVGTALFMPHFRVQKARRHLPHILRNAIILLFGWQRLTLIGTQHTQPLTIAAISIIGVAITLIASRNIDNLRLFCTPLMAIVLALPFTNLHAEWFISTGIVCVAISTILSRNVMRELGAPTLLSLYFSLALLMLPIVVLPMSSGHTPTPPTLGVEEILLLVFQSTLGSALPLYLLLRGSAESTPLTTALSRYIQSAITVLVFYIPDLSNILILIMISLSALEIFVSSCKE